MYDPAIREYVKFLAIELIRQEYFSRKDKGLIADEILVKVRAYLKSRYHISCEVLDSSRVNKRLITSITEELIHMNYLTKKRGVEKTRFLLGDIYAHFYQITDEGLNYLQNPHAQPQAPNQFIHINGVADCNITIGDENEIKQ